jgi:hypothetical protein
VGLSRLPAFGTLIPLGYPIALLGPHLNSCPLDAFARKAFVYHRVNPAQGHGKGKNFLFFDHILPAFGQPQNTRLHDPQNYPFDDARL